MRLRAAMALGEEGRETLVDLVARADTGDSCAARAIVSLGERLSAKAAGAALRRALGGAGRPLTARACLEALGQRGRPEAEGLLLEALRSEEAPVSVAAAQALGRAGTVTAVAPLLEAAERSADLRRAARQAIAEIQARLAGAEPGQLSLAGGEAGALSLADGEPGAASASRTRSHPRTQRRSASFRGLDRARVPEESPVSAPVTADSSSPGETKLLGMTRRGETKLLGMTPGQGTIQGTT